MFTLKCARVIFIFSNEANNINKQKLPCIQFIVEKKTPPTLHFEKSPCLLTYVQFEKSFMLSDPAVFHDAR